MNTYFERYAYPSKLFNETPSENLKLSVVIPCFNEPDILPALESLNNCLPVNDTEVIIIINEPESCSADILQQNKSTINQINNWQTSAKLNLQLLIHHLTAPAKDAGVGFARKVGMDEAARRFTVIENPGGVICCFDADSICDQNYLHSVYQHFYIDQPKPNAAAIYFEHPLPEDKKHVNGIIQYELHLRYYVQALRYIDYPYAHHTVGSSMVVRSDIYQKVGGMNKRKAGEDFYFLHRVMPTGNFIDINDTVVYPSARISDRVPFGTGKAMAKWQENESNKYLTYNLQSFLDLKVLFGHIDDFYKVDEADYPTLVATLPDSVGTYLQHISFSTNLNRLNKQSNNPATFKNNWYRFFDGFRVLKYLHYARDNFYSDSPVLEEAKTLAKLAWNHPTRGVTTKEWLLFYRQKDQEN